MAHYTEDRDPKIPRSYVRMDETVKGGFDGMVCGRPCASTVTSVQWMTDGQKFLTAGQDGLVKVSGLRVGLSPSRACLLVCVIFLLPSIA